MAAAAGSHGTDEIADRTSVITGRLKSIYRKTVLPVEKKYRYDYFYESPLLTDVEFDGTSISMFSRNIQIRFRVMRYENTRRLIPFFLYDVYS